MTRIGVLSDTHLPGPSPELQRQVEQCFAGIDLILHAGDLTDLAVLDVFRGREVHAVHGNMCQAAARNALPARREIRVGGFTIGLVHGLGLGYDFADRLPDEFPEADCIVFGHTHRPVCHRVGHILLLNPGSFLATGRYGARGSYAVIEVGETLSAAIYEVRP